MYLLWTHGLWFSAMHVWEYRTFRNTYRHADTPSPLSPIHRSPSLLPPASPLPPPYNWHVLYLYLDVLIVHLRPVATVRQACVRHRVRGGSGGNHRSR